MIITLLSILNISKHFHIHFLIQILNSPEFMEEVDNFLFDLFTMEMFACFCLISIYGKLTLCCSFVQQHLLSSYCLTDTSGSDFLHLKLFFYMYFSIIHSPRNVANIKGYSHLNMIREVKMAKQKYCRAISTILGHLFH